MDQKDILDGLISYFCLIILITFHEFGHAWMAWRRGDDTARLLGRITLNPLAHMEVFGTVVLPLLAIFLASSGSGLAGFIIGWGKPVPVNSANLKNRGWDWVLIALAGPGMNVLLGILSVALARGGLGAHSDAVIAFGIRLAVMNFALCYFNLLPIPPLDGSHVARYFIGMSEETYLRLCQYGFFAVIIVIQFRPVQIALSSATYGSVAFLAKVFGLSGGL